MRKWTIKPRILLSPTKCHFNLTSRLFETNIASWMYETSRNARSIYLAWSVQYGIGSIRLGKELPITDITVLINQKVEGTGADHNTVRHVLEKMRCVHRTSHGSSGGYQNSRNPGRFVINSRPSSNICSDCHFEHTGTVGCILSRPNLKKISGLG